MSFPFAGLVASIVRLLEKDVKISLLFYVKRRRLARYLDRNNAFLPANTFVENVKSNNVCACVCRQSKVSIRVRVRF